MTRKLQRFSAGLDRLDQASTIGSWTRTVLGAIAKHPEKAAGELASLLQLEKEWLKVNIRKLKELRPDGEFATRLSFVTTRESLSVCHLDGHCFFDRAGMEQALKGNCEMAEGLMGKGTRSVEALVPRACRQAVGTTASTTFLR